MMLKVFLIGISYLLYWTSFICFALTLFRFKLKSLLTMISISVVSMTVLSLSLQLSKLIYLLSIIQFTGLVICMWVIFRFKLIPSVLIIIPSFLFTIVTEWGIGVLLPHTIITFVTDHNQYSFLIGGLFLSIAICLFTIILRLARFGFSFINRPDPQLEKHRMKFFGDRIVKLYLTIGIILIFIASICFFLFPGTVLYLAFFILIIVVIFLRISYKWEMVE